MTDNDDEILLQCADCKGLIMPIIVKDVDNGRGVIFEGTGVLNTREYVDALKKHLTQDPQIYKEFRYCLADYTGVTKTDLNFELMWDIIKLAEKAYTVNPNMVVASVADSDAHYGVARMSESLIEHVGVGIQGIQKTRGSRGLAQGCGQGQVRH